MYIQTQAVGIASLGHGARPDRGEWGDKTDGVPWKGGVQASALRACQGFGPWVAAPHCGSTGGCGAMEVRASCSRLGGGTDNERGMREPRVSAGLAAPCQALLLQRGSGLESAGVSVRERVWVHGGPSPSPGLPCPESPERCPGSVGFWGVALAFPSPSVLPWGPPGPTQPCRACVVGGRVAQ